MNEFFINHITNSISYAEQYKSKLPLELLSMNGMSGKKLVIFIIIWVK